MLPRMDELTVNRPIRYLHDFLVTVDPYIFLADFGIIDCVVYFEIPINSGRSFLCIRRAFVDMENRQMMFRMNNEEVTFKIAGP